MAHRSIHRPDLDDPSPFSTGLASRTVLGRPLPRPTMGWLVGAALLCAAGVACWWLLRPAAPPVESSLPLAPSGAAWATSASTGAPLSASPSSTSTTVADLVVQAAGALAKPGVYHLPTGARVVDLVHEAGGFTHRADTDRVNLASPLADGQRIWVPAIGQTEAPDVIAGSSGGGGGASGGAVAGSGSGAGAAVTPADPVDLNAATAEELDALPGVGPATAAAILSYRDQNGPFSSVDDLLEVRGIGDAKLEQLRPLVRV